MRKPREKLAKFKQVLEYMDGPQAVLLERSADAKIVALAIDLEGYQNAFFGAEISIEQWDRYRRGFVDLNYLFVYPRYKNWYYFDLAKEQNGFIELIQAEKNDFTIEQYIPEKGFWAYNHSEKIKEEENKELATQKYSTDGIWDLPDFTQFYNKLTDLYAFFLSLKKYEEAGTPAEIKKRIRDSFREQPLRGGSSYRNLHEGLSSIQRIGDRLAVGRLQYSSPGRVDVKGRLDVFKELAVSLAEFTARYEELKDKYNELHRMLAKGKWLKADPDRLDKNGAVAKFFHEQGVEFAKMLRLEDYALIYRLTGNHALLFLKVLLAHYRRLEKYFMFFAEGRVKEPASQD
jgi:hypothetical protein